jgi:D-aminopeptidase
MSKPPEQREPRLRELGLRIGELEPGPTDSIADVAGVQVGHVTVCHDEPVVARTGVTAVVPPSLPLPAGMAVLNGAGELTGSHSIREWGLLETPVYLTSTLAVGRIYDGAVDVAVAAGAEEVLVPVVGECDDSHLSEVHPIQVEAADAGRSVAAASGWPIAEGAVGAGTGMSCLGWKGGIGTASRVVPGGMLGALVLANFGTARQLRVAGVPVGRSAGPGAPASAWRAPARWPIMAAARSLSRSRPRMTARPRAPSSTTSSRLQWTPRRKPF